MARALFRVTAPTLLAAFANHGFGGLRFVQAAWSRSCGPSSAVSVVIKASELAGNAAASTLAEGLKMADSSAGVASTIWVALRPGQASVRAGIPRLAPPADSSAAIPGASGMCARRLGAQVVDGGGDGWMRRDATQRRRELRLSGAQLPVHHGATDFGEHIHHELLLRRNTVCVGAPGDRGLPERKHVRHHPGFRLRPVLQR